MKRWLAVGFVTILLSGCALFDDLASEPPVAQLRSASPSSCGAPPPQTVQTSEPELARR